MLSSLVLAERILESRRAQLEINRNILNNQFSVPVHLALGHESIATALSFAKDTDDFVLLNHRNIHYHLAFGAQTQELIDEYKLLSTGLAGGKNASMNLHSQKANNIYTSNILGSNLGVSLGVALHNQARANDSATWVVTGDGAIEEGIFYETLLAATSWNLALLIIVEDNGWSLATKVNERRVDFNLMELCSAFSIQYLFLDGNNPIVYFEALRAARIASLTKKQPIVVHTRIRTLGSRTVEDLIKGTREINYHAGGIPHYKEATGLLIDDETDPSYVAEKILGAAK
jgi:TPP-dependent pyruvate/acetoin dehydrogenase alpha subunit